MCDMKIKKLKVQFHDAISNAYWVSMQLYKYDGSGDFTDVAEWDEVSSRAYFTVTPTQDSIAVNEEFEVDPVSWNLSKGDKYIFRYAIYTTSGTHNVKMTGAMTIEEDWNDML